MKRVLLLVPVLLAVVLAAVLVARGGPDDDGPDAGTRLTADAMPFPRSTTPLPVPEVRIGELPWRDELAPQPPARATPAPGTPPRIIECNGSMTYDVPLPRGGMLKDCRPD